MCAHSLFSSIQQWENKSWGRLVKPHGAVTGWSLTRVHVTYLLIFGAMGAEGKQFAPVVGDQGSGPGAYE